MAAFMIKRSPKILLFLLLLGYFGYAISGNTPTEETSTEETSTENSESSEDTEGDDVSTKEDALVGNFEAGEERYKKSCINCHGAAGKGVASYPKISGEEILHTMSRLETYRDGIKIGPNSSLMIMMAKPLTDEEIANLAAYLKDAKQ